MKSEFVDQSTCRFKNRCCQTTLPKFTTLYNVDFPFWNYIILPFIYVGSFYVFIAMFCFSYIQNKIHKKLRWCAEKIYKSKGGSFNFFQFPSRVERSLQEIDSSYALLWGFILGWLMTLGSFYIKIHGSENKGWGEAFFMVSVQSYF